jgi:RHS repeat-associated protein
MAGGGESTGLATTVTGFVGKAVEKVTAPIDALNLAVGRATYAFCLMLPKFPAARLWSDLVFQFGHSHLHPPTFGFPLPSVGPILASGSQSVLINGLPAARCGDLGLSVWCGGYVPIFEVLTGSSHVFIGGARASRQLFDLTFHCLPDPFAGLGKVAKIQKFLTVGEILGAGIGAGMSLLGAAAASEGANAANALAEDAQAEAEAAAQAAQESEAIEAQMQAMMAGLSADDAANRAAAAGVAASTAIAQAAADIAALAMSVLMGKDPGVGFPLGMIITGSPNVLIGGFPMPGWMTILRGLFKMLQPVLRRVQMKLPAGKLKKGLCFLTGDPVEVASGRVVTSEIDFEFPGRIPFVFERSYDSSSIDYEGPLGWGWTHTFDQHLWYDSRRRAIIWRDSEGRVVGFDPLEVGERVYHPLEKVWLERTGESEYLLRSQENQLRYLFGSARATSASGVNHREGHSEQTAFRLLEIRDRNENRIRLEYVDGRLRAIDDLAGLRIVLVYENRPDGKVRLKEVRRVTRRDQSAMLAIYSYNEEGELSDVTDQTHVPFRYYYEKHLMVRRTTRSGLSFYFEFVGEGREAQCVHTWGDGGIYERWITYQPRARVTIVRDSLGGETIYNFNEIDQVTRVRDAEGGIRKYEYGQCGELLVEEDELGRKRIYSYDDFYNCSGVTHEDGTRKRMEYNSASQLILIEDEMGSGWVRSYDDRNNLVKEVDPLGGQREFKLNERGDLIQIVDATGNTTSIECDQAGLTTSVRRPAGGQVRYAYDDARRLVETRDEITRLTTRYKYDRVGRLVGVEEFDANSEAVGLERNEYDAEGNITRRVKANGAATRYRYTGFNRLHEVTDDLGHSIRLGYDSEERLVMIENQLKETCRLEYDLTGRPIKETGFDGGHRSYEYDAAGRLVCQTDAGGSETRYVRDPRGRVVKRFRGDVISIEYEYDNCGRMTKAETPSTWVAQSFDAVGNLLSEQQNGNLIEYQYDSEGRCVARRRTSPNGVSTSSLVHYEYDPDGSLVGINAAGHDVRFGLDKAGRIRQRELPNGLTEVFAYNPAGRLASQSVTRDNDKSRLLRRTYEWDPTGNLLEITDSLRGAKRYDYDSLERLSRVKRLESGGSGTDNTTSSVRETPAVQDGARDRTLWKGEAKLQIPPGPEMEVGRFTYDGAGNLVALATDALGRLSFSYGSGSRLEAINGIQLEYDAVGNLIQRSGNDGVTDYTYDADNQLVAIDHSTTGHVEFTYDAFGRRTSKKCARHVTTFLWDGDTLLLEERQVDGAPGTAFAIEYVYEPDTFIPVLMIKYEGGATVVQSVHTDDLGTTQEVSDDSGALIWKGEYDEYGSMAAVSSDNYQPLRFQGQYEDSETGIYYNRFRYYDPHLCRYINKDPIGLFGGLNHYSYSANPRNNVDPLGLIIVYRNLRPDEDPLKGLVAKNPGRGMTPAGHIMNGSRPSFKGSQFISTTTDPAVAAKWRQPGQRTVAIDTDLIHPDVKGNLRIVDVSTADKARAAGLKGRTYSNAISSREVLIEGHVPPHAIKEC